MDNIKRAHFNARRGKAHYREVKMVNADSEYFLSKIQTMLKDKTFRNSKYKTYMKTDSGKEREIFKLPYFPDRIIHHCIVQVLEDIWTKTLIADTYSSLKNRGIHKGVARIKLSLKDIENTKYCLKMDVRKFYPSIDHDILKSILAKKIKCPNTMWILNEIIDSTDGVPIGNYLSQFFGNLYLSGFDHWMKEEMQCKHYFRYCDDVVVLHASKEHLAELRIGVDKYLQNNLKLQLKNNWQIFPVESRGIDFLGYKFYHNHTLLRKSIATKFKYATYNIINCEPKHIGMVNGLMSYIGWIMHGDCYNLVSSHVNRDVFDAVDNLCTNDGINNPLRRAQ